LSAGGWWRRTGSLLFIVPAIVAAAVGVGSWARAHDPAQKPQDQKSQDHKHDAGGQKPDHAHDESAGAHVHAPVPPEYKSAHVPSAAWTDPRMLARGKEIYAVRCAVCHGETGDGKGPAGLVLPLKPPDLRDQKMMGEMAGNYWVWRISEGGVVEPFKSMGSAMPAWKAELSVEDRWAVIAYQHTFSGHDGPHVVSEHAELATAGHGDRAVAPTGSAPATAPASAPQDAGHKH
jgi:mono/diheme cytochrome c family protein